MIIGVISDTHGLLRPEAFDALRTSSLIVHAGDIGPPLILERLSEIAPVRAVRGNNDRDCWAGDLPESESFTVAGWSIFVVHDVNAVRKTLPVSSVVIAGHSHKPTVKDENGVLFLNPGSAGPRRFRLPISVARLHLDPNVRPRAEIVELAV